MKFKSLSFYLSLFCFPVSLLAFINILYSSYFDYFLSIESYFITLIVSLFLGIGFYFFGKNSDKKIDFINQIILIVFVYLIIGLLISIPFYLSNFQVTFLTAEMAALVPFSLFLLLFVTCKQHLEVSGGLRWLWFSYIRCANTSAMKPLKEKAKKIRQTLSYSFISRKLAIATNISSNFMIKHA